MLEERTGRYLTNKVCTTLKMKQIKNQADLEQTKRFKYPIRIIMGKGPAMDLILSVLGTTWNQINQGFANLTG
jgi:hypothetical protein